MKEVFIGASAGLFSTLFMDFVASQARKKGWIQGVSSKILGRWVLGLFKGHLTHYTVIQSLKLPHETKAAIISHYLIGAGLGSGYTVYLTQLGIPHQAKAFSFAFGLLTNIFPWFVLFPALGFGWLGLQGPKELKLFRTSFFNHAIYGIGLFLFFSVVDI